MKNEFVPYDIALAMKELDFNEKTICYYTEDKKLWQMGIPFIPGNEPIYGLFSPNIGANVKFVAAPLYQQAFRGFREKYNIDARFHTYTHHKEGVRTDWMWDYIDGKKTSFDGHEKSDKEAQDACLRKLIEIVEGNL